MTKAKVPRSAALSRRSSERRTRAYIVDDHEISIAGIQKVLADTPEGDLVFCGGCDTFGPEAVEMIRQARADVVFVDITEGGPDHPIGLKTIRLVRRTLGPEIGIIGYSVYPGFKDTSLNCGADKYLMKGATAKEHRSTIRTCKKHDYISKIEMHIGPHRRIRLWVANDRIVRKQVILSVSQDAFDLVYYLAEERMRNDIDWIVRVDLGKEGQYQFTEQVLWAGIRGSRELGMDNLDVTRHAAAVNRSVKEAFPESDDLALIIVPGQGRKKDPLVGNSYYLTPFIGSSQVEFQGTRIQMAAAAE